MFGNGFAGERQVDSGAQMFAGDRDAVAGSALVKLAAVGEATIGVEQEKVRGAGGFVSVGDGLRFIIKVGKFEAERLRLLFESCRAVGGVGVCVVAADGDDSHGLGLVIF